jgi:hypothetical protein
MPFEEAQARIIFTPGPKFTMTLSGGVEDRQFINPSAPPLIGPVFSGTLLYHIFEPTTISLNASRTITPSLFEDQVETITAFGGSVRQQLSKKISIGVNAGYTSIPQTSIVAEPEQQLPQYFFGTAPSSPVILVQEANTDTVKSCGISLSYAVVQRATISVFYTVRDNSSSEAELSGWSHQGGFSFNYHY